MSGLRQQMVGRFLRQPHSFNSRVCYTLRVSLACSLELFAPLLSRYFLIDIDCLRLIYLYKKAATDNSVTTFSWCPASSYSHRGRPPTTIGAEELNFRVRYGNGCDLFAIITRLIRLSIYGALRCQLHSICQSRTLVRSFLLSLVS